jgi:hypothetical protein
MPVALKLLDLAAEFAQIAKISDPADGPAGTGRGEDGGARVRPKMPDQHLITQAIRTKTGRGSRYAMSRASLNGEADGAGVWLAIGKVTVVANLARGQYFFADRSVGRSDHDA